MAQIDTHARQLEYAPPPKWYQRPVVRRWAVRLLLLAAIIFPVFRWGPESLRQAKLYRAQRQCLNYVTPQGQLVYASDPNPDEFLHNEGKAFRLPAPACWALLESSLPQPISLPKDATPYLNTDFSPLAPAPVFLHRRSATGNTERLLAVQFGEQGLNGKLNRVLCCRVICPATLRHRASLLWEGSTIIVSSFQWGSVVRVYAGKADDLRPAHFTLDVDVDGVPEVIDGWLQSDDGVKLQMRNGAAK